MGLRIAIVHYHLRPGGVTRVIENAVLALKRVGGGETGPEVAVLVGSDPAAVEGATVKEVPGLGYLSKADGCSAEMLFQELEEAAVSILGGAPDLWHFHNHHLGKNVLMPEVVQRLAASGQRLLLQLHDFPEDSRPTEYASLPRPEMLYPDGAVHYATINERDRTYLKEAGIPESRLHGLPNAVHLAEWDGSEEVCEEKKGSKRLLFYPTRAIRRKNLGEALLLALLADDDAVVACSREPDNERWRPFHDRWRAFAETHGLPVAFAVVDRISPADLGVGPSTEPTFSAWLEASDFMITTSIAEGFGLAYLEPLGLGRPLIGRDLPAITRDFKAEGVVLEGLYERILVPRDWLPGDFGEELNRALTDQWAAYGLDGSSEAVAVAAEAMGTEELIDFGRLNEKHQEQVLERLLTDGEAAAALSFDLGGERKPVSWLTERLSRGGDVSEASSSLAIINERFSLEAYGKRLGSCYAELMEMMMTKDEGEIDFFNHHAVLEAFLSPSQFFFLRS
ncbi:MAG: hypothetical protein AAF514_03630 [Verrucomicrobiota bacterium]